PLWRRPRTRAKMKKKGTKKDAPVAGASFLRDASSERVLAQLGASSVVSPAVSPDSSAGAPVSAGWQPIMAKPKAARIMRQVRVMLMFFIEDFALLSLGYALMIRIREKPEIPDEAEVNKRAHPLARQNENPWCAYPIDRSALQLGALSTAGQGRSEVWPSIKFLVIF